MLVDVHAHLDFPQFDPDRDETISRARKAGVHVISSGMGPESIKKTLELAGKHDNVFATLGLSPTEFSPDALEETVRLIRSNRDSIVGLGEVGLDYYWVKGSAEREKEKINFASFISLSRELSLPLVVHSRDAEGDVIGMLKEAGIPALMHCFSGSVEGALDAISFGCLISVPTSVAYSKKKQELARTLPLESLVLETDSPFLSPQPKTRNEPANVTVSRDIIAGLKGLPPEDVAAATSRNALKFFDLKLM